MMKILFIIILIFLNLEKGYTLPIGNPSDAKLFFNAMSYHDRNFFFKFIKLNIGYYGDYVFQRDLETVNKKKIDYTQISTNAAYMALNFCEFFDIFTTLGATKFKFNTSLGAFNNTNTSPRFDFESSTTFSWSIGSHATLWKYKCVFFGIEGQYFSSCPKPKVLFVRTNVNDYPDKTTRRKYSEWQIGAGISYHYNCYCIPYAAIKYNRAFWDFNNETFNVVGTLATVPSLRSHKNWGYAIGATLVPFKCKNMAMTVEGRFADEAALHVNAQLQF